MNVIIVDDHPLYRDALSRLLASMQEDARIDDLSSCRELLEKFEEKPEDIDLVLLDLGMPGEDPFQTIRQIHQKQPSIAIVVVSGSEIPEDTRRAIASGAMGFISKSLEPSAFITAIEHILSGGISVLPSRSQSLAGSKNANQGKKSISDKLTQRQQEVLKLLANGDTNKMIANQLGLTEGTVKLHVRDILQRLGVNNRTQAVSMVKDT